jgi:hypothetical protein
MANANLNEDKELLAAYTVLDAAYKNAVLRYIPGTAAGAAADLSPTAIEDPATAVGVPSIAVGAAGDPDPVLFTFTVPDANNEPQVRILLVKVDTPVPGGSSTGRYSVLKPHEPPSGTWETLARDVYLLAKDGSTRVAGNPHALAHTPDGLYIIDYDSQKIWPLGITELDGEIDPDGGSVDHELDGVPIDVGAIVPDFPANAKGQDLVYLRDDDNDDEYLFVLYQVPNPSVSSGYDLSWLVRLKKNASGIFVYDIHTDVGMNAQAIIPVTGSNGKSLFVPALGGIQHDGSTNGENSTIHVAAPFVAADDFEAEELVKGDNAPSTPATFDIAAIAASVNGTVYILTFTFASGYSALNWKLYKTTVDQLLDAGDTNLSVLEELPNNTNPGRILTVAAQGPTGGIDGYGGLNYWNIVMENGSAAAGNRLWFRRDGIQAHDANNYSASPRVFDWGLALGETGGVNINSFDLAAETIRQARAGVSSTRGFKSFKTAAAPTEEEEEEKA